MDPASAAANEMATCAVGMPRVGATTAEAYSHGSRRITSGAQSAQSRAMAGSMARAARRPNSSRLPRVEASSGGATGRRSRMGATSASGGSPPASKAKPACSTRSRSAGGPMTSVS